MVGEGSKCAFCFVSRFEFLNSELCKITAPAHCVMGHLADCGLDLKPKLMLLFPAITPLT